MDDIVVFDKPVDRCRAFVEEYAAELFGIPRERASALAPMVEIAFDVNQRPEHRLSAARELAKYTEVPTRSIEYDGGKKGPDLEVTVLGACEIRGVEYSEVEHTQPMVPQAPSSEHVELHDGRGEESG